MMKLTDFYYDLPQELIAQDPLLKRSESRLMVLDRKDNTIEHKHFYDVIDYLNPGDCLVINDTRFFRRDLWASRRIREHP